MHQKAAPTKAIPRTSEAPAAGPLLALVAANIALAFGPWFVRVADVGPVASGFWRISLALPVLLALCAATGQRPHGLSPKLLWLIAVGGIAFAADLASWHIGILSTTLANATLFGNSATLFFPVYGFLIARAWPGRTQALALVLALLGAGLLLGRSYSLSSDHLVGDLLCLLAGVLYTLYFIVMARARETMTALPALAISTLASAPPLLIFALVLGEKILPYAWTPVVALALCSQVIGQSLMIYAIGRLSPLVMGIGLLIQPIVGGAIGWIVYDERLGGLDLLGAALVAAALVLVRRSPRDPVPLAPAVGKVG